MRTRSTVMSILTHMNMNTHTSIAMKEDRKCTVMNTQANMAHMTTNIPDTRRKFTGIGATRNNLAPTGCRSIFRYFFVIPVQTGIQCLGMTSGYPPSQA
jgi:hypothetical protein